MALAMAIQHWRPYLIGRRFQVRLDQHSLKRLLQQPISTLAQQNWVAKLKGYDFEVIYKPGKCNGATDALSRRIEDKELIAVSRPQWVDWSAVERAVEADNELSWVRHEVIAVGNSQGPFSLVASRLYHKGCIVLPASSPLNVQLIEEFHSTPFGGHVGALGTYKRLASSVYWRGMMK